jgi:hypothetical protein
VPWSQIPDPAERAVKMAVAMRGAAAALISSWRRLGRDLGFGAGIAQGYATLGQIGFSERSGYTAIGTVCNVAARLCAEAKDGQLRRCLEIPNGPVRPNPKSHIRRSWARIAAHRAKASSLS